MGVHTCVGIFTTDEDKKIETSHVRKSLRRCGHPRWTLDKEKKKNKEDEEKPERRGKVVIPYIKHLSERLTRVFKRYNIETIYKPTTKLKTVRTSGHRPQNSKEA